MQKSSSTPILFSPLASWRSHPFGRFLTNATPESRRRRVSKIRTARVVVVLLTVCPLLTQARGPSWLCATARQLGTTDCPCPHSHGDEEASAAPGLSVSPCCVVTPAETPVASVAIVTSARTLPAEQPVAVLPASPVHFESIGLRLGTGSSVLGARAPPGTPLYLSLRTLIR